MPPGERRGRVGPIRFRTFLRNTVLDVMRSRGWLETDSDLGWDFFWADVGWIREVYDHVRLDDTQRVNHFRNHCELTRKDLMVKNLKRMRKNLEREGRTEEAAEFDFFPVTFSLPQDYGLFELEFRRQPNAIWIMKPPAKAQGKGIFLFSKISQIAEWRKDYKQRQGASSSEKPNNMYGTMEQVEPYLAQRYVDNPHLVGGKKYDLRVYVLVTGYTPLTIWLHRTGFARFCHHRFSLSDIDNTFIHVTNVAVQKTNPKYTPLFGCKYGLRNLRQYITATCGVEAAKKLFSDIQNMIIRTLHAVQRVINHDRHCFELYGYDIMVDDVLHPWLIEINASPSLSAETPADYHLKFNMLEDMFNVLDFEKRRTGDEVRVGGFDLIWQNGPIGSTQRCVSPKHGEVNGNGLNGGSNGYTRESFLGCANEFEIPVTHIRMPPRLQEHDSSERLLT